MKDLNLLRVFEAMWSTRSVSKAAERLGLTQPAVSSALARMRETYSDPMFTRSGTQMSPTAFCAEQAHFLLDALALVDRSLSGIQTFEPATSTRAFTLGMRDIGEAILLPRIIAHCEQAAPKVRFRTLLSPLETTNQKLADGRVDLAIGFLPSLESGIHRRELFPQHYVCAMRTGHPLHKKRLTMQDLSAVRHIAIDFNGTGHALIERQLREQGLKRRICLHSPHYMSMASVLAASDLVCLIPSLLAEKFVNTHDLHFRPIPLKAMHFPIALYWHDRYHRDAGNRWLRGLFVSLFAAGARRGGAAA